MPYSVSLNSFTILSISFSVPQTAPSEAEEQYPGAVSPDGNINWDCPCLGGLGEQLCQLAFKIAVTVVVLVVQICSCSIL